MNISIEDKSGFCFGVRKVVETAESLLDRGIKLYCLGEIVHNPKEIKRLKDKGLVIIDHADLKRLKNETVLIRAHGEPPETFTIAGKNNLTLIDGTCPIVTWLQKKIRLKYEEMDRNKEQIIIYGKKGHPEVNGLRGQTRDEALLVKDIDDLDKITLKDKVSLFSQTTMSTDGFQKIVSELKRRNEVKELQINNTICRHVSHRAPGLKKFASEHGLLVFVAGRKSSNGRILYEICRKENPRTHFISDPEELNPDWFVDPMPSIGVCGATSTPRWLLEAVAKKIEKFTINSA